MSDIRIEQGEAKDFTGTVGLVLSNIYGPLPAQLCKKPMLISQFATRLELCEKWTRSKLTLVSTWNQGREAVWIGNAKVKPVDLTGLMPDEEFFPLDLPLRLLKAYGKKGLTVFDGCMGRGTVGKACQMLDMNFIGIDKDPGRVALAREYLGLDNDAS